MTTRSVCHAPLTITGETVNVYQREVSRPQASSCDAGAYEAETQMLSVKIEGTCDGRDTLDCVVTMTETRTVTATFNQTATTVYLPLVVR